MKTKLNLKNKINAKKIKVNKGYIEILLEEGKKEIYENKIPFQEGEIVQKVISLFKKAGWKIEKKILNEEISKFFFRDVPFYSFS